MDFLCSLFQLGFSLASTPLKMMIELIAKLLERVEIFEAEVCSVPWLCLCRCCGGELNKLKLIHVK